MPVFAITFFERIPAVEILTSKKLKRLPEILQVPIPSKILFESQVFCLRVKFSGMVRFELVGPLKFISVVATGP